MPFNHQGKAAPRREARDVLGEFPNLSGGSAIERQEPVSGAESRETGGPASEHRCYHQARAVRARCDVQTQPAPNHLPLAFYFLGNLKGQSRGEGKADAFEASGAAENESVYAYQGALAVDEGPAGCRD